MADGSMLARKAARARRKHEERLWVRPYKLGDRDRFTPRDDFLLEMQGVVQHLFAGAAFSLIKGAATVRACGGAVEAKDNPGVVTLWGLAPADLSLREWWEVDNAIAVLISDLIGANMRRIECYVRADNPAAVRFIERHGLEGEGVARAYGPDRADYLLMARVA